MRYIFDKLEKIKKTLEGKCLFLFLDCDGTLAPIADTPDKAVIPRETKGLLNSLSKKKNCGVAIISGRALADIRKKTGLKNIIYSGNHGFQIEGPGIKYELAVPSGYKKILRGVKLQLKERLYGIKGVFVEDKGLSLALHFRLAGKRYLPLIKTVFHESVILYLTKNKIKVKKGKKIFEVIPPVRWDKGRAVLWLLGRQKALPKSGKVIPVYIGDDATDEDAFKALKRKGLTVFVGKPGNSQADYYLKNTEEVIKFLRLISGLRPG